jgi:hypothetical protein
MGERPDYERRRRSYQHQKGDAFGYKYRHRSAGDYAILGAQRLFGKSSGKRRGSGMIENDTVSNGDTAQVHKKIDYGRPALA